MTPDQARAHLLAMSSDYRSQARSCRDAGEVCKRAANEAVEEGLTEVKFDESSEWFERARAFERDADAIDIVLGGLDATELRMIADLTRQRDESLALVREASEIMTIVYAGNFPAGIESFLVRAAATL